MSQRIRTEDEIFEVSYVVNPETGCWEWTGWIHPKGYGILTNHKLVKTRAHRFSYRKYRGPISDGKMVLHHCDNRKCVCPDHLYLGDARKNMADALARGRRKHVPSKLTYSMVLNIRVLYARGRHSMQNLADIYLVDQQTISLLLKGRTHAKVACAAQDCNRKIRGEM